MPGERLEDDFVVPAERLAITVQANFFVRQRLPRKDSANDDGTGPDFHSKIIGEHDHALRTRTLEEDFKRHRKEQGEVWETWRKGSLLGQKVYEEQGTAAAAFSAVAGAVGGSFGGLQSNDKYEEARWKGKDFKPPDQKTLDGTGTMYSWYNPATLPQVTAWAFSGLSGKG